MIFSVLRFDNKEINQEKGKANVDPSKEANYSRIPFSDCIVLGIQLLHSILDVSFAEKLCVKQF